MFVSPESSPGRNFYPRPPRGGRRIAMSDLNLRIAISIHALREEGDPLPCCRGFMSIHALREEGDVPAGTRLC